MAPMVKMHTLGHGFVPQAIHAGGLRYHGVAPLISHLYDDGCIEAVAYPQNPVFDAAVQFARSRGHRPGARVGPRHPGGDRRGAAVQRGGRSARRSCST